MSSFANVSFKCMVLGVPAHRNGEGGPEGCEVLAAPANHKTTISSTPRFLPSLFGRCQEAHFRLAVRGIPDVILAAESYPSNGNKGFPIATTFSTHDNAN